MTDREKVIGELEVIKYFFRQCRENFSLGSDVENSLFDLQEAASEAITLLKEQGAVEPEVDVLNEIDRLYKCPKCHKHFFYKKQKYCDQCGQEVKWNENT